jgi:hypothetical protein
MEVEIVTKMAASQNRSFWKNLEKTQIIIFVKSCVRFMLKMSESTDQDGLGVLGLGAKFKKS